MVDGVEARVLAVDNERDHQHLDVHEGAVATHPLPNPLGPALLGRLAREIRSLFPQLVRPEDELVDEPADRLVGGVPKEGRGGRVPAEDALVAIHGHDGDRTHVDQRLEVLLLASHLRGRVDLAGHVDEEAQDGRGLAVLVADQRVVVANPDDAAIGSHDAVLA